MGPSGRRGILPSTALWWVLNDGKPNLTTFPAGNRGRCLPSRAEAGPTKSSEGIPEGVKREAFSKSSHNHWL